MIFLAMFKASRFEKFYKNTFSFIFNNASDSCVLLFYFASKNVPKGPFESFQQFRLRRFNEARGEKNK